MRIAVIGNCQVVGVAETIRFLRPDAIVETFFMVEVSPEKANETAATIEDYDLVISHLVGPESPLHTPLIRPRVRRLHMIPSITFTGFHPDAYLIQGYRSGAGNYHSQIVSSAFVLGLEEARTAKLFNAFIYATLGYFEAYSSARAFVLAEGAKASYDLAPVLDRWSARGRFMHSINHPDSQALADLGRTVAIASGLVGPDAPDTPLPYDKMGVEGVIYPVYPEIARRLSIDGSLDFRRPDRTLSLIEFIRESFTAYRQMPRDVLVRSTEAGVRRLRDFVRL